MHTMTRTVVPLLLYMMLVLISGKPDARTGAVLL